MLSYILSQRKTFEETIINHQSWYEENGITLNKGDKVVSIDKNSKQSLKVEKLSLTTNFNCYWFKRIYS